MSDRLPKIPTSPLDVATLIEERDRLATELAVLRPEYDAQRKQLHELHARCEELEAERDLLRAVFTGEASVYLRRVQELHQLYAERDRLVAALRIIVDNHDTWGIAQLRSYIRTEGRKALAEVNRG